MSKESTSTAQPSIEVCFGPQCSDFGSRELAEELKGLGLKIIIGDCRSQCPHAPLALVNTRLFSKPTPKKFQSGLKN